MNPTFQQKGFFAGLGAALATAFSSKPLERAARSSGSFYGETSTRNRGGENVTRRRGSRKTVCAHPIKNFQGGIAARIARHASAKTDRHAY